MHAQKLRHPATYQENERDLREVSRHTVRGDVCHGMEAPVETDVVLEGFAAHFSLEGGKVTKYCEIQVDSSKSDHEPTHHQIQPTQCETPKIARMNLWVI